MCKAQLLLPHQLNNEGNIIYKLFSAIFRNADKESKFIEVLQRAIWFSCDCL